MRNNPSKSSGGSSGGSDSSWYDDYPPSASEIIALLRYIATLNPDGKVYFTAKSWIESITVALSANNTNETVTVNAPQYESSRSVSGWDRFWANTGAFFLNMEKDDDGVYHVRQKTWQSVFGFTQGFDDVFQATTSMESAKFYFTTGERENSVSYVLWAWKGDYLNLGAGAELGIYTKKFGEPPKSSTFDLAPDWESGTEYAMPMTLTLNKGSTQVFDYNPTEKQWWITGFNPAFKDVDASDLSAVATIEFSGREEMFEAFYDVYKDDVRVTFDVKKNNATIKW